MPFNESFIKSLEQYIKNNFTSTGLPTKPDSLRTGAYGSDSSWWGQLPYYTENLFLGAQNRGSGLYSDFQNQLMKSLGGQFSTNSLLGMGLGMGGGEFGGSQLLANEKMKQMQGKMSDIAVGATDQFYSGMQDKAFNLLQLMFGDRWKESELSIERAKEKKLKEGWG